MKILSKLCQVVALGVYFLLVASCSNENASKEEARTTEILVSWHGGYKMAGLLEQPATQKSIADLAMLAEKKWYAEFSVYEPIKPEEAFTVSSCKQLRSLRKSSLSTTRERDNAAFMEVMVMCNATYAIMQAKPSTTSYLSDLKFDSVFPAICPKQIAMITSTTESKKIADDDAVKYWGQVEKITNVIIKSPTLSIYKFNGGEQEIELVARGDFNQDGIEDMMITSRDSVEDGSYSAIRLFFLTRKNKDGKLEIINTEGD